VVSLSNHNWSAGILECWNNDTFLLPSTPITPHMEFNREGGEKKIRVTKAGVLFYSLESRKEYWIGLEADIQCKAEEKHKDLLLTKGGLL